MEAEESQSIFKGAKTMVEISETISHRNATQPDNEHESAEGNAVQPKLISIIDAKERRPGGGNNQVWSSSIGEAIELFFRHRFNGKLLGFSASLRGDPNNHR
ncbi:hypothetical protein V8G54_036823 [Vigna mungo]|uniref:Uncharacterized protein n=1 Tax=Vigna mungo TaxID=3915 RepID=A0AAQ3MHY1_VIGMU